MPPPRRTRLFVRLPNWLGDVVMALPLVRALRASQPDAEVTAVVRAGLAELVERTAVCDAVVPLGPPGVRRLREFWRMRTRAIDTWIMFTNSTRGDIEAWLSRAPRRVGMVRPGRPRPLLSHGWKLPADLDETRVHQMRVWERMLGTFSPVGELNFAPVALRSLPETLPPLAERDAWIGVIAGSENMPAKRWPAAHWRSLLERVHAAHPSVRFALFGTASDGAIAREVAGGFGEEHALDLAGRTNLLEYAGALRQCRLVVTNDTGGMHLANALGVPVIALFGPTNPVRTGPVFEGSVTILQPPGCPPTGGGTLTELAPETVAAAVERLV